MNPFGIGEIISGIRGIADDLYTSDEERLKISLQEKTLDMELAKGQLEVNKAEASHKSIFVAGWRPAIGWVGALALAYQFLVYPLLIWVWVLIQAKGFVPDELQPPPVLDAGQLWPLISGMLGLGAMRSHDKSKGTQTDKL